MAGDIDRAVRLTQSFQLTAVDQNIKLLLSLTRLRFCLILRFFLLKLLAFLLKRRFRLCSAGLKTCRSAGI